MRMSYGISMGLIYIINRSGLWSGGGGRIPGVRGGVAGGHRSSRLWARPAQRLGIWISVLGFQQGKFPRSSDVSGLERTEQYRQDLSERDICIRGQGRDEKLSLGSKLSTFLRNSLHYQGCSSLSVPTLSPISKIFYATTNLAYLPRRLLQTLYCHRVKNTQRSYGIE